MALQSWHASITSAADLVANGSPLRMRRGLEAQVGSPSTATDLQEDGGAASPTAAVPEAAALSRPCSGTAHVAPLRHPHKWAVGGLITADVSHKRVGHGLERIVSRECPALGSWHHSLRRRDARGLAPLGQAEKEVIEGSKDASLVRMVDHRRPSLAPVSCSAPSPASPTPTNLVLAASAPSRRSIASWPDTR